ncbi:uncharacterized protein KIAA1143 homolog [Ixodes scapularis]|uniref:uncharacterized protein KIAA1143 homolog n=1 Tax=Ixodes scapularis TaxID=6945 RepID=UPI001A9D9057|nr:uncharacterized protein KIAA1143 homolog [Ixodes scapularis]
MCSAQEWLEQSPMPRQSVTCIKPEDAPFIKRLKERVGFKEDGHSEREEPDRREPLDLEDEKPTVVVLGEGDLTAEQAEALEAEKVPAGGRIRFQKPSKRKEEAKPKPEAKRSKGADSGSSAVKNARLLSFADEDDDASGSS